MILKRKDSNFAANLSKSIFKDQHKPVSHEYFSIFPGFQKESIVIIYSNYQLKLGISLMLCFLALIYSTIKCYIYRKTSKTQ